MKPRKSRRENHRRKLYGYTDNHGELNQRGEQLAEDLRDPEHWAPPVDDDQLDPEPYPGGTLR